MEQLYCTFNGGFYMDWTAYGSCALQDDNGHWWFAESAMPSVAGPFEWTQPFVTITNQEANWDFLLDGEGVINLSLGSSETILLCGSSGPFPYAEIEKAVFVIDGDFPVQVEPGTWGRLKALFR